MSIVLVLDSGCVESSWPAGKHLWALLFGASAPRACKARRTILDYGELLGNAFGPLLKLAWGRGSTSEEFLGYKCQPMQFVDSFIRLSCWSSRRERHRNHCKPCVLSVRSWRLAQCLAAPGICPSGRALQQRGCFRGLCATTPRRSYWVILGLYWDNGKENGNYYSI